jgi:hypothetical protein
MNDHANLGLALANVASVFAVCGGPAWAQDGPVAAARQVTANYTFDLTPSPDGKRAVLMTAEVDGWQPTDTPTDWAVDAREITVPYPAPRGAATRLVRYFLSTGDRALTLDTDERGAERLYGNLRTAAHRLALEIVTVRRQGNVIQLVRLPRAAEPGTDGDSPWPE